MKVTNVTVTRTDGVPLLPSALLVYEAILKTGLRRSGELSKHLNMSEGLVDLMLAHLLRYDLIEVRE